MMKTTVPSIDMLNMHMVYHCSLQLHSISCIGQVRSCLVTASTSVICFKARLVTNNLNLVCLHFINGTTEVTNNKIIAVTNRKTFSIIIQKGIFLSHF